MTQDARCGMVALVGRPNAGKSTLMNALVGAKVSIVSRKAQTTRMRIMGVLTHENTQMVFIDTPGIFTPKGRFEEAMVRSIQSSMRDADLVLMLMDVSRKDCVEENTPIIEDLKAKGIAFSILLNKIDLIPKTRLLEIATHFKEHTLFMISAKTLDGVTDLQSYLLTHMPLGPFLFDKDALTNLPERLYTAEITREQIFHYLHDELPYQIYVDTDKWEPQPNGSLKIYQTLYVMQEKHRSMVLGKGGASIKRIGEAAREEIATNLGVVCHLFLHVKVDPKWQEKKELYHLIGLEF